jgi:hypothetical protein
MEFLKIASSAGAAEKPFDLKTAEEFMVSRISQMKTKTEIESSFERHIMCCKL